MMKKYLLLISIIFGVQAIQAQSVLRIDGSATSVSTVYVSGSAQLYINGGILIDGSASPQASNDAYLQNNGKIHLVGTQSKFENNVTDLKTYTQGQTTGEVIFESADESQSVLGIGSVEFMNLRVYNASTPQLNLFQNVGVKGILHIGGLINIRENNLSLLGSGVLAGSPYSAANMIQADDTGEFIRTIVSGAGTYLFPVGDAGSIYSPASIEFLTNAAAGSVGLNLRPITHPEMNNPEVVSDFLSRYWSFSNEGLTNYTYNASFSYVATDINGVEQNIKLSRWANPWVGIEESNANAGTLSTTEILDEITSPLTGDYTGRRTSTCAANSGEVSASNETVCAGDMINLFVEGNNGGVQWQSSTSPNNYTDIENATEIAYSSTSSESLYFRAYSSLSENCADTSDVIFISVVDAPEAGFTYEQVEGYTVEFTNSSTNGTTYKWDFAGNNFSSQEDPEFTYPFEGFYPVILITNNSCGSDTLTIMIEVKKTVSIDELSFGEIFIYPNPSSDLVFVKFQNIRKEKLELNIYNAIGQIIYSKIITESNTPTIQIDLSRFSNGLYIMSLKNNHKQVSRKITLLR